VPTINPIANGPKYCFNLVSGFKVPAPPMLFKKYLCWLVRNTSSVSPLIPFDAKSV
jgi:hypothetical protein